MDSSVGDVGDVMSMESEVVVTCTCDEQSGCMLFAREKASKLYGKRRGG